MSRLTLDDLSDVGVTNLMCELITTAKEDFYRAHRHLKDCEVLEHADYTYQQALYHYERSKRFFYSDLFFLASGVRGDEYVKYLLKEEKQCYAQA